MTRGSEVRGSMSSPHRNLKNPAFVALLARFAPWAIRPPKGWASLETEDVACLCTARWRLK